MKKPIRIATRTSPLALWQANEVKKRLEVHGHSCELVLIESSGDLQLTQPLYAMGISGIFTKQLDIALLNDQADIAVHSLKDVPTILPENLVLASVLERGSFEDVLIIKDANRLEDTNSTVTIATSSLRRSAQWLAKYPNHKTVPIRGNVQTRLKKFAENQELDGIIFAKAGLERVNLLPENAVVLDWMISAPAQGIVGIVCREDDAEMNAVCKEINHEEIFTCANVERQFMRSLQGGCSVPISAYATADIENDELNFIGAMHSFDGKEFYEVKLKSDYDLWASAGSDAARLLLEQKGAPELLEYIKNKKWNNESPINENA